MNPSPAIVLPELEAEAEVFELELELPEILFLVTPAGPIVIPGGIFALKSGTG